MEAIVNATKPWVNGAAFAVLFAVIYVVCAVAVILAPDATVTFFNRWSHGIDLSPIMRDAADPLAMGDLVIGFLSAVISAFVAGFIYGWARNFFMRLEFGRSAATLEGRAHAK
jgi:hypothetical protein